MYNALVCLGLYGLATYFWAKIVSDMMLQFYLPIIYSWYDFSSTLKQLRSEMPPFLFKQLFFFFVCLCCLSICWYLMGLNDEFWRFLAGTCFIFLMSLSVASIGYIVASFSPHVNDDNQSFNTSLIYQKSVSFIS